MNVAQEAAVGIRIRRAIERSAAIVTVLYGASMLLMKGTFGLAFYSVLDVFLGAGFWGLLFFTIGVVRIVFLFVNGYHPHSYLIRMALSGVTLLIWAALTASFWWLAYEFLAGQGGVVLPGIFLAPFVAAVEACNVYALGALSESKKKSDG